MRPTRLADASRADLSGCLSAPDRPAAGVAQRGQS
jgi:hypothetical protein